MIIICTNTKPVLDYIDLSFLLNNNVQKQMKLIRMKL